MQLNNRQAQSWLNKRGITDQVLVDFNIEYSTTLPTRFSEGIIIPVNKPDGSFSFNKYRRDPMQGDVTPKYTYDTGARIALFGADRLTSLPEPCKSADIYFERINNTVVITEGELDTLVLWSMNIAAVSSTGGAMSFQKDFVELLNGYEVYLCYDNDDAGCKGMAKTLKMLPDAKIIMIPERPGIKDISDFVGSGGDFKTLMESAKRFYSREDVEDDKREKTAHWLPTRFHDAWLDLNAPKTFPVEKRNVVDGSKLERAKATPCTELMQFSRTKKATCLWHNEKTASLTYYPKTNNVYCFGCSKYADSVDIYMAINNVSFRDAIEKLS